MTFRVKSHYYNFIRRKYMPSIFNDVEKDLIREHLLSEGEKMMLESGITKMNLEILASSAGIAKGTFYNFFKTKQYFILAIIRRYQSQRAEVLVQEAHEKKGSLTLYQAIEMYLSIYDPKANPFFHMRDRDLDWIAKKISAEDLFDSEMDLRCCGMILSCVKDYREGIDLRIVSNFSRMVMFTLMQKNNIHKEVFPVNVKMIIDLIANYISDTSNIKENSNEL